MTSWLMRILDIGSDPADDRDLAVRKRTAVATNLALSVASGAYALIGWTGDRPLVVLFSVIQITGQLLNLAMFRFRRQVCSPFSRSR